uniref:S-layer homology domain-containing protein n=1 Tax=Paenibacillus allorhizosphaerae TaxID=2849866 RepID=UPI0038B3ACA2
MSGYPDGTMRPDAPITRVEGAKVVNRLFGYEERSATAFADVCDRCGHIGVGCEAAQFGRYRRLEDHRFGRGCSPLSSRVYST